MLIGLLNGHPSSYLSAEPTWEPQKDQFGAPQNGKFLISDLLRFDGVKIT